MNLRKKCTEYEIINLNPKKTLISMKEGAALCRPKGEMKAEQAAQACKLRSHKNVGIIG